MAKYKIGSNILHLSNCKDVDYLIIDDTKEYIRVYENGEDIVYSSTENILKRMKFKTKNPLVLFNYQMDFDIIGQDFPIEYHLLDYRQELIEQLKRTVKNKQFNFNKRIRVNKLYCSKCIYHIAYNIFILQNNSPIITEKQKAIVQKIHDGLMPIEYIDVLENMLNQL